MSGARAVALLVIVLAPNAAAAAPVPSTPVPLLAWTDDPPATEVRPLSGLRTVALRYGAALDPATFHATLDGERVSPAFHPQPGTDETVALDLIGGRNHLVLQAASRDGLTHITLDRWIVLARFPGDENAAERVPSAPELRHELWQKDAPEATKPPAATPPTAAPPPPR